MGARNFLFVNVPPMDRSPEATAQSDMPELKLKTITDWNRRLAQLSLNLSSVYPDTAVFLLDSNKLFNEVLDDPSSHIETAGYRNLTGYCEVYKQKLFHPDPPSPQPHYYDPSCGVRIDEYLWIDGSHPTWPMHQAIATEVVKTLELNPIGRQSR